MAFRGPALSSHVPKTAADSPRKTMAMLKIQPSVLSFQSSGADSVMPITRLRGKLNTLKAYASPMARWMASAAGGTSQRLKVGLATVRWRSNRGRAELRGGAVTTDMVHPQLFRIGQAQGVINNP